MTLLSGPEVAGSIPAAATAPALLYVACLMMSAVKEIDFDDATDYVPAVVTVTAMPLTFSIAHGLAFGFISWTLIKLLSGRISELNAAMTVLAVVFLAKFV